MEAGEGSLTFIEENTSLSSGSCLSFEPWMDFVSVETECVSYKQI